MQPLKLTLVGFIGIKRGLGLEEITLDLTVIPANAQLVALAGQNGDGKTTLLDNLHPYPLMASRSSTLGPGGFAYYDHIGPVASKTLEWRHAGRVYRSVLNFKVTPKTKKTEAYLFIQSGDEWRPAVLSNGTPSDGKIDTYDQLIVEVLGEPERFFTSQFAAQNRRALSDYTTGEIKTLLASILNLHHLRDLSSKAGMVVRQLAPHIDAAANALAQAVHANTSGDQLGLEIAAFDTRILTADAETREALNRLEGLRERQAELMGKRDGQSGDNAQRVFLSKQLNERATRLNLEKLALKTRNDAEHARLTNEYAALNQEVDVINTETARLNAQLVQLNLVIAGAGEIQTATIQMTGQQAQLAELVQKIQTKRAGLLGLPELRIEVQSLGEKCNDIRDRGNAAIKQLRLYKETAALRGLTPCAGTAMQTTCPLMENANHAFASIKGEQAVIARLRVENQVVFADFEAKQLARNQQEEVETEVQSCLDEQSALHRHIAELAWVAPAQARLALAQEQLPQVTAALAQQVSLRSAKTQSGSALAQALADITVKQQQEERALQSAFESDTAAIHTQLKQLATPVTQAEIDAVTQEITQQIAVKDRAESLQSQLNQQKNALYARQQALYHLGLQSRSKEAELTALKDEAAQWRLLETGLGNDGLVALSIDDAGPEIARLCNGLLQKSSDGRFMIRLDTQKQTQKGNVKETFDIIVFDSHGGDETVLDNMSGGERVWVNECLTRAIALYVAQTNPTQCQTLFSDETDGPLDPERKRAFMRMKREVLAQGGYSREYFISQSRELVELADYVIDVRKLAA